MASALPVTTPRTTPQPTRLPVDSLSQPVTANAEPLASTPTDVVPIDMPEQLITDPVLAAIDPVDEWFSPGNSPGIAEIGDDFDLSGGTLLFEIAGTEAGLQYDQLLVEGVANLDYGTVVFGFINGFVADATHLFDLILASEIEIDYSSVDFYYGLFDSADDPYYANHAPKDLSLYSELDATVALRNENDINQPGTVNGSGVVFQELFGIRYVSALQPASTLPGPNKQISSIVIWCSPGPRVAAIVRRGFYHAGRRAQGIVRLSAPNIALLQGALHEETESRRSRFSRRRSVA